jgi:glycerol-3-phosphate dehydrogenase
MSSSLNAARRERELGSLVADGLVDVLVIGGGVTGTGVALDAASRGLSVVLAEKHDLAFGTSRWSSKLVHGGLRYLASGKIAIAHESAVERGILIEHTAPHLVRPFPQLFPLLPQANHAQAAILRAGLAVGDALRAAARTSRQTLPRSRRVTRAEVQRLAPTVRGHGLRGGLLGWDGQLTDDARMVVALARTAALHGARIFTRCEATEVTGQGAVLHDRLSGQRHCVDARIVINAAGVWAGQLAPGLVLRPSRGTHLVLSQKVFSGLSAGLTVAVPGERGRFVFALPAPDDRVYVGLTDEGQSGDIPDVPTASDAEIDFLLDTISSVLQTPLNRGDVLGSYCGLRPLLDVGGGSTSDISRRHQVIIAPDGLVTVVGGKLTTYRRMAQDAVDTALDRAKLAARGCRTTRLPLVGATSRENLSEVAAPQRLVQKYGVEATHVLSQDAALNAPIADGISTTQAELRFAVAHEGALDIDDLLDRRTRIGLVAGDRERALAAAEAAFVD